MRRGVVTNWAQEIGMKTYTGFTVFHTYYIHTKTHGRGTVSGA